MMNFKRRSKMPDDMDVNDSVEAETPAEETPTPDAAEPVEQSAEGVPETGGEAPGEVAAEEAEPPPEGAESPPEEPEPAPEEGAAETPAESSAGEEFKVVNEGDTSEEDAEAAMLEMLADLPEDSSPATPNDINFGNGEVSKAEFQPLSEPAGNIEPRNIDILMDVDLPVAIELGRTRMKINDILALGPGSVVELNKLAGEPVDLLVNAKIVARGEVVVVDENFGLRITQLLTPEERLKALGDAS
jgi:flagellar motor switch protein FliN/FliY